MINNELLSTGSPTSTEVIGSRLLANFNGSSNDSRVGYQVTRETAAASGNFEVMLEARFGAAHSWGEVATIDQDEVNQPSILAVCPGLIYRFRHVSGANVRVFLKS